MHVTATFTMLKFHRDVVDVFVAGVVAGKRGTLSCVRGVSGPDPLDVFDIFFAEDFHDVAECFGHVCVGVAGTFFTHAPVVPVAVCFVEGPEPDFFTVILDALGVVADVGVGLAVHQFLRVVAGENCKAFGKCIKMKDLLR